MPPCLQAGKNDRMKEIGCCFGRQGEELAVQGDTHALLALAHAELTCQFHLVAQTMLTHQILQGADNLA